MNFIWDEEKNQQNIIKHGVSFEDAKTIFDGFTVDKIDDRYEYNELREISIGMIGTTTILVVVHTDRNNISRIISARQALRKERKHYEKEIYKTFNA